MIKDRYSEVLYRVRGAGGKERGEWVGVGGGEQEDRLSSETPGTFVCFLFLWGFFFFCVCVFSFVLLLLLLLFFIIIIIIFFNPHFSNQVIFTLAYLPALHDRSLEEGIHFFKTLM